MFYHLWKFVNSGFFYPLSYFRNQSYDIKVLFISISHSKKALRCCCYHAVTSSVFDDFHCRLEPDYSRDELRPTVSKTASAELEDLRQQFPAQFWATALAWTPEGRLFAIGKHGFVFEVLVDRHRCAGGVAGVGLGTPTSIDASSCGLLAVGTENGHVATFSVDGDGPGTGPCFESKIARVSVLKIVMGSEHGL
jgi:hypothetical protein